MYLISEGDRKLLQLLKRGKYHHPDHPDYQTLPTPQLDVHAIGESSHSSSKDRSEMDRMYERLHEIKFGETTSTPILPPPILKTPGVQIAHRGGGFGQLTEDMSISTTQATPPEMTLPTIPFGDATAAAAAEISQPTPSEVFRATPFVLPPPTAVATRLDGGRRKRGCKEQLAECRKRLDNCLKIVHWNTVGGQIFLARPQKSLPHRLAPFAPHVTSTPMPPTPRRKQQNVNKRLQSSMVVSNKATVRTPRPKRQGRKAPSRYTPSTYV